MLMKRMLLLAVLAGIAAGTAGCKQQDAPNLDRQAVRPRAVLAIEFAMGGNEPAIFHFHPAEHGAADQHRAVA